jgi:hypothetical protein
MSGDEGGAGDESVGASEPNSNPAPPAVEAGEPPLGTVASETNDGEWQRRTMPWMLGLLLALSSVFVLASISGALMVRADFRTVAESPVDTALHALRSIVQETTPGERLEPARFLTLASLDARMLELRYHQTSSMALASIWTRFMGYLTGMILALVGAIFVLGKIRDTAPTSASGSGGGFQGSLTTTWPGLVLVAFGTLLMVVSSQIRADGRLEEAPSFTQHWLAPSHTLTLPVDTTTAPDPDPTAIPCGPSCEDTTTIEQGKNQ